MIKYTLNDNNIFKAIKWNLHRLIVNYDLYSPYIQIIICYPIKITNKIKLFVLILQSERFFKNIIRQNHFVNLNLFLLLYYTSNFKDMSLVNDKILTFIP